jgi:hypothetical protein
MPNDLLEIVNLLSGLGTFIAAVIGVYALIEVRRQRRDSLKPHLLFRRFNSATAHANEDRKFKSVLRPEKETFFSFQIINAGSGVAENIRLEETFDVRKAISLIKSIDRDNVFHFTDDSDGRNIIFNTDLDETWKYLTIEKSKRKLGYMVPSSDNSFVFDEFYMLLVCCYMHLSPGVDFMKYKQFPAMNLKLRYKDILGKSYERKFKAKMFAPLSGSIHLNISPTN